MFNGKNILVTGGAGFVGVNLINSLLKSGAHVRATLHSKSKVIFDNRIEYIRCDLTRSEDCRSVTANMDLVFMCAANTSGAAVIEESPLVHVTPNVIMNTLMLEAAYAAKVEKFLFISTNTVYPNTEKPVAEDEMMNGELFEKYFCVGWMKRFSEILCEMYSQKIKNPMNVVVARPGNIYGEYDNFEWRTSHVLPALIRKAVERHDPFEVWGDGSDIKDFIYVGDFVDGLLLAMEKTSFYDPINIASGESHSINEVLSYILKSADYENANVIYNASKPTMIPSRRLDISKASKLGFRPKVNLEEGIDRTVQWYKNRGNHV